MPESCDCELASMTGKARSASIHLSEIHTSLKTKLFISPNNYIQSCISHTFIVFYLLVILPGPRDIHGDLYSAGILYNRLARQHKINNSICTCGRICICF